MIRRYARVRCCCARQPRSSAACRHEDGHTGLWHLYQVGGRVVCDRSLVVVTISALRRGQTCKQCERLLAKRQRTVTT